MLAVLLILALALLAPPALADEPPVATLTVSNGTAITGRALARAEGAVVVQARQVRRWWGTPLVRFGPGGIPVYLVRDARPACRGADLGCHGYASGGAYAVVSGDSSASWWQATLSHEVVETIAGREICDDAGYYQIGGVPVNDFDLPTPGRTFARSVIERRRGARPWPTSFLIPDEDP